MTILTESPTEAPSVPYPGIPTAMDGTGAVVAMETAAGEAAGAYPITPSTQMGEGWALAAAQGTPNVFGRRLLFFEPEGEHAAAAVTAGMAMVGLRSANFSSGQGIAYMHESLYAAVGKRLTYVLNMACRAMTKHALNVHAGHDDYHAIDDTGFFQLFAKDAQESADLNLIAHRIAELALTPGVCAQDGFLTSHVIESLLLPERELIRDYLGDPADRIESPTPAQRLVYGETRRRIPEVFDFDAPAMVGVVQNQDAYAQGVASQRPFFFDHLAPLTDRAMAEYARLSGRLYRRVSGYRCDDAEAILVGQGSIVGNAEALADHLRREHGIRLGVINLTMFRPFPADALTRLLTGKGRVLILERTDQPLAVDGPIAREVRAALSQAAENGRAVAAGLPLPHPGLAVCAPEEIPELFSACFGLGSRDLQAGDLAAAVENVLPGGAGRRFVYLGIDFIRRGPLPQAVAEWQEKVLAAYPGVDELALPPAAELDLRPEGSMAVRIHSVGGWGAITMGKNLTMTLFELLGLNVKSNPKYGSEKKGQPTTFFAVFAHQPIRVNCELKHVDVVLSPDPNVFRHSNPLAGLAPGGVFVIQSDQPPEELWASLPAWAQAIVRERELRVFALDAFAIARAETGEPDLVFRMQGGAFQGAFFKASPLAAREGLDEERLFAAIRKQIAKKFGHRGEGVVEDNLRVIRRGFDEVREIAWQGLADKTGDAPQAALQVPWYFDRAIDTADGVADPFRFLHQVCALYKSGSDPIADPFAALSVIPAATGVFRDMTDIRFEVPRFLAERCTGCGQCWTQCPDAAIPGLVVEVEDALKAGFSNGVPPPAEVTAALPALAAEVRRLLAAEGERPALAGALARAAVTVAPALGLAAGERAGFDAAVDAAVSRLTDFTFAVTAPFFSGPERRQAGFGGLLAVTINPNACKGCNLCVEVCPDAALLAVRQDDDEIARLRDNWALWQRLPDTPDRFLQVSDLDRGIGVLHTLLLKKRHYQSMVGGDGACMGCGEKTGVHLITATIEAAVRPRAAAFVGKLEGLIAGLRHKTAELLTVSTDLDLLAATGAAHLDLEVAGPERARLARLARLLRALEDLHWRYTRGPSGRGRATLGIANSTGCSSVWGSTYPFNPYPYPWTNHLFQDAPSVAIGLFEGTMRKMADGFAAVRKTELELADAYDPAGHDRAFAAFDWSEFSDEEFHLCPPILALGGDGAMLDIGFQNVSRLMASGKPLRVVVLDTQVYSNTGGQACTSGFKGQVSDMAAYGPARHGKEEQRKELGLIAMAHRSTFVVQSSQASPAHLVGGVLRALCSRRPALINVYTPCQAEHGLPDSASLGAAKLALEGRAFPYLVYDPDAGATFAERLDLDGNPALDDDWPTYELTFTADNGAPETITLPLTTADWAATEPRFGQHFHDLKPAAWSDTQVPLHEFLLLSATERAGKEPFLHVLAPGGRLGRRAVSAEMVDLCEDRLDLWDELRELAGVKVSDRVRNRLEKPLRREAEARLKEREAALKAEYETRLAELHATYPAQIVRRIAEALVGGELGGDFGGTAFAGSAAAVPAPARSGVTGGFEELGREAGIGVSAAPAPGPGVAPAGGTTGPVAAPPPLSPYPASSSTASAVVAAGPALAPAVAASAEALPPSAPSSEVLEPWIDTELCTSCNECTNLNPRMFAYDGNKKAFIKDPHAGTFQELVKAAERCTARIIHPGTPLDPDEADLEKWLERAQPFN